MKKVLEKSGKSQGILSDEKSGNPEYYREEKHRKSKQENLVYRR